MRDLFSSLMLILVSVVIIAVGIILTVTFVFAFVGIPFVIVGSIMLLVSIFSLAFGTIGGFFNLVIAPFRGIAHKRRAGRKERKKEKGSKVVEVEREGDVYKAKKKRF